MKFSYNLARNLFEKKYGCVPAFNDPTFLTFADGVYAALDMEEDIHDALNKGMSAQVNDEV